MAKILWTRRARWAASALLAVLPAGMACASPYHVTGLDAADSWEVKLISTVDHNPFEHAVEGAVDITAPLAPGLETSVSFGKARVKHTGQPARNGWTDTEVAVKWEIVRLGDGNGFGLTTEPALFVPSASHGVGDDEWQVELPVVLGYRQGPVELRGLIGYARALHGGADEIQYGAVMEYALSDRLSIGGEVAGSTDPGAPARAVELEADIGFTYALAGKVELQGRFGQSLRNPDHIPERQAALYLEVAF